MHVRRGLPGRVGFLLVAATLFGCAPPPAQGGESEARAAVRLFDTGTPLPSHLSAQDLTRRSGWTPIAEDTTDHRFAGDAVMFNGRLALAVRRGRNGAELYARNNGGLALRSILSPATAGPPGAIESLAVAENAAGEAALKVGFGRPGGDRQTVRFALPVGQPFARAEAASPAGWLAIESPSRFVVLPDFFADDIVVDATQMPAEGGELPSENFLLHLLPGGESMVMTVAGTQDQDARITLGGQGLQRCVVRSEVGFGKQRRIWIAVLECPGIWHHREVSLAEADKILPLEWKAPFAAQWRVDWRSSDRITHSWEMILQRANGDFEKPGWFGSPQTLPSTRRRWNTVLGYFPYPCWLDREGRGYLQPLKKGKIEGPAILYPINRLPTTPLDAYTVVDVVRATLGVGPCEYILDVEGQGATMKGRATCATRDALKAIYSAGEQKARRREIERILDEVIAFVTHIRGRIESYREFGRELLVYLEHQKQAHPELAGFLSEMETLTRGIDAAYERRRESIQSVQYVVDLVEKFRQTVLDDESPQALEKCNAITNAIVQVGGNQDELVGESRLAVKILRQRAGLAMASDPRTAEIAREIRARTQKVLRNASSYEAPRH